MSSINSLTSMLNNITANQLRSVFDSKKHEGFSVSAGVQSSSEGVVGGTLEQPDYEKFMNIVKGVNVLDASYRDMSNVYRKLVDANLVSPDQVLVTFFGSVEFDGAGNQINDTTKYNQLEFQRRQLPLYSSPGNDSTRNQALSTFKLVAAIANASEVTGSTVAKESISEQDRQYEISDAVRYQSQFSELAQRLAKGERLQESDVPDNEDVDIVALIKQLELMAQAKRAAESSEADPLQAGQSDQ
jgi:hypothetical protein